VTARGPAGRLAFLDGLRGLALIFMVVNHTARVIAFTLVRGWLGVTLGSWWAYALANAALLAGLVLLARARAALPRP